MRELRITLFTIAVLASGALMPLGCGEAATTTPQGDDAGSDPLDGGAEDSDSANDVSDASEGSSELVGVGFVVATMSVTGPEGGEQSAYLVNVSFELRDADYTWPCSMEAEEGECYYLHCDGAWPDGEQVSGGRVELRGTLLPVSVSPDASGHYDELSGWSRLWQGGEVLTASAAGADAPAFETTLVAPNLVTVTEPTFESFEATVISSTSPLSVAWENGSAGDVHVELSRRNGDKLDQVGCYFDAAAGHGTVPVTVLQRLAPGPDVVFGVGALSNRTVSVGGWAMTAYALLAAVLPSGNPVSQSQVVYE